MRDAHEAVRPCTDRSRITLSLTATVSSSTAQNLTAGGSVTFYTGTTSLGSAWLNAGQAVLSNVVLPAGHNSLKAKYSRDANFASSTSNLFR
jgi:hypothetical protein